MENINAVALQDLQRSALNEDTIRGMGCYSLPPGKDRVEWLKNNLGYAKRKKSCLSQVCSDILAFPYPCDDYTRVRLYPAIDDAKYLCAKGSSTHLYYLKSDEKKLRKNHIPIIFNEGEKKTACVSQFAGQQYLSLGSSGITQWKNCPEWKQITLKGREVYIAFDRPEIRKPDLEKQLLSLWLWLWKRRAIPKIISWDPEYEKIDDWLCAINTSKDKSCIDAIKESISSAQTNVFDEIKDIDEDYFAETPPKVAHTFWRRMFCDIFYRPELLSQSTCYFSCVP
ncbi:DUF3854 domain-containing protein [Candidatus Uabimicrobium amorphum]|uniref:DUF3854 domain-containing protein n=1 Tax=Uabimicrobium amorphum TaxID=2596890 RepID=A0A5S9INI4_UABAM|nr:DUF3854 domain-containing protein [Candidatus Uabimicrobium amorphum]BBM84686.1 hypothetical protein UABAM_03047 [Candidatus Uabimicrobium amorphum]